MGIVDIVASMSDQELEDLFYRRLPELLERRPDLEPTIFKGFVKALAGNTDHRRDPQPADGGASSGRDRSEPDDDD